jgi:hypothetical protein
LAIEVLGALTRHGPGQFADIALEQRHRFTAHAEVKFCEWVLDVLREVLGEEDREIPLIGKERLSALR